MVLATVVWFWQQSSAGCRSGASLGREDVRKERRVKNKVATWQRHVWRLSGI